MKGFFAKLLGYIIVGLLAYYVVKHPASAATNLAAIFGSIGEFIDRFAQETA